MSQIFPQVCYFCRCWDTPSENTGLFSYQRCPVTLIDIKNTIPKNDLWNFGVPLVIGVVQPNFLYPYRHMSTSLGFLWAAADFQDVNQKIYITRIWQGPVRPNGPHEVIFDGSNTPIFIKIFSDLNDRSPLQPGTLYNVAVRFNGISEFEQAYTTSTSIYNIYFF